MKGATNKRAILTWDDVSEAIQDLPQGQRDLAAEIVGTERGGTADAAVTTEGPWYLVAASVRGHAGIGEQAVEVSYTQTRGLTIVSARNGTGKTSLVDAIRWTLSGQTTPGGDIVEGNIHSPQKSIAVKLTNGQREVEILCDQAGVQWSEAGTVLPAVPTSWNEAFARYLPVLLHSELSRVIDDPGGKLHDFLKAGLSLDVLERLLKVANDVKKLGAQAGKAAGAPWQRAQELARAAGLDEIARAVAQSKAIPTAEASGRLRATVATLPATAASRPGIVSMWAVDEADIETIAEQVEALRRAGTNVVKGTREVQRALGEILSARGEYIDDLVGSDTCPVCQTPGAGWYDRARSESDRLGHLLADHVAAEQAAQEGWSRLTGYLPPALTSTTIDVLRVLGSDEVALRIVEWNDLRSSADSVVLATTDAATVRLLAQDSARLAVWYGQRVAEIEAGHNEVVAERAKVGEAISAWLDGVDGARKDIDRGVDAKGLVDTVTEWIKQTRSIIFEPIGDEIERLWSALNPDADLAVGGVDLSGGVQQQRKVGFDITVDGARVPKGVDGTRILSTGQRNALLLAAYLPRATQPGTPFGFLILDDPIHAFDTWRVRYLAKELIELAKSYQVIVLTHDDRLWRELRALDSRPNHIRLERRQGQQSHVVVKDVTRPGELMLRELDDLLRKEQKDAIGTDAATTAMTLAMCRQAFDVEIVTQLEILGRRLGKDDDALAHDQAGALTTQQQLDLLNDYARRAKRRAVNYSRFQRTIDALNAGAHGEVKLAESRQRVADGRKLVALIAEVS